MNINEFIKKYDTQNQFQVLIDSYKQIENAWKYKFELDSLLERELNNVVICGMGGSAISADLLKSFLGNELKLPCYVNRDYYLPPFANDRTLVIISSYSGNTEETISCFKEALEKKCNVVAVSTGGWIKDYAIEKKIPWIKLEKGFQPRFALGASFSTLMKIFQLIKLLPNQNDVIGNIVSLWKSKGIEYSREKNSALKIAEDLIGFIPVIYASKNFEPVAYRLKCQFNENSKLHAFTHSIPELNHNEIIGWETFLDKQLNAKLLFLIDNDDHPQILKRFEITGEIAKKSGVEIVTLQSIEKNSKVRIMDLIYLGDWITYYLAILRGFDPSEIDFIHELKQSLT